MTDMKEKLRALLDKTFEAAANLINGSGPENEMQPTWLWEKPDGTLMYAVSPFVGPNDKDILVSTIGQKMREDKAVRYSFSSEAWMAQVKNEAIDEHGGYTGPQISKRDDRIEILMITAEDNQGNQLSLSARIKRSEEKHRYLEEPVINEYSLTGRFSNLLLHKA